VALEIVDEGQVRLALGAADLVDADDVRGRHRRSLRPPATATRMIAATVF